MERENDLLLLQEQRASCCTGGGISLMATLLNTEQGPVGAERTGPSRALSCLSF